MDEFEGLLALRAVAAVLCGPVALAVSLAALQRIRELQSQPAVLKGAPPVDRHASDRPGLTSTLPAPPEVGSKGPVETVSPTQPAREPAQTVDVLPAPPTTPAETTADRPPLSVATILGLGGILMVWLPGEMAPDP